MKVVVPIQCLDHTKRLVRIFLLESLNPNEQARVNQASCDMAHHLRVVASFSCRARLKSF